MAGTVNSTSLIKKIVSLAGVSAFCYAVIWISPQTFFSDIFSQGDSYFVLQFERHFWQFSIAIIAVVLMSRGHLWSYGINSQNLKTSMQWLMGLYAVTITATMIELGIGIRFLPEPESNIPQTFSGMFAASLVYWMSSPVANQILFFSFGQTVLMKQWGESLLVGKLPVYIVLSSIVFAFGATTSQYSIGEYSFLVTFFLGLYSGIVYWKTNSLITPMLGHAFFFGFPLFIRFLRIHF